MKLIKTDSRGFAKVRAQLLARGVTYGESIENSVRKIIDDVRVNGDRALIKYTKKFDRVSLTPETLQVDKKVIQDAYARVNPSDVDSLKYAASRIRKFHEHQKTSGWQYKDNGVMLGQMVTPLDRVGVYVPGGKAVYPSTVLMSVIPARIAGVKEVIVCTPTPASGFLSQPELVSVSQTRQGQEILKQVQNDKWRNDRVGGYSGAINPYILVAADIAGADRIYTAGGAQAVAAMAYGTDTVPRVDKIAGPGNIYVAVAKKLLYGQVDIDMIAGPSEILIVADDTAEPSFVAMDMLSQAEHDEEAVAVLITTSESFAKKVVQLIKSEMKHQPRRRVIRESLRNHGLIIVARDLNEAVELTNEFAAEHLSLQVAQPEKLLKEIRHAGAVFLGSYTPQTMGDYVAGPNHTLPTGGTARFFSPLSVDDFVKKTSVVMYSRMAIKNDGSVASRLAEIEGLYAHSEAVRIRMK
ncbi:MAG: histidinol dehydrogenase [Nitrospirae bacterium]|nr:histidinol dehydrogenase [Nitrospirota bacterium]